MPKTDTENQNPHGQEPEPVGTIRLSGHQFREVADVLRYICRNSPSSPALSYLHVESRLGQVIVTGSDLGTFAIYRTDAPAPATPLAAKLLEARALREDGRFMVPLSLFRDLAKCEAAKIDGLSRGDRFFLRVEITLPNGQVASDSVGSIPISEFPPIPAADPDGEPIQVSEDMLSAIRDAMKNASSDESRSILQAVAFDASQDGHHCIVSTDSRRLYCHNSQEFPFKDLRLLPKTWLTGAISGPLAKPGWVVSLPREAGWSKIVAGRWTFYVRAIPGIYPDWKQAMPSADPVASITCTDSAREEIVSSLPRLPAWKSASHIKVTLRDGRCLLRVGASEIPFADAAVAGELTVAFNSEFFLAALRQKFCRIEFFGPESPARMVGGSATLILMPVKLKS